MTPKVGGGCSVVHCKNYFYTANGDISYFGFPKDEALRQIWLKRCKGRLRKVNPDYARVCSKHFRPDDFERDFQAELTGQKRRRRLKPGAVPSLRLSGAKEDSPEPTEISSPENEVLRNRNSRDLVERLLKEHDIKEKEIEEELTAQQKLEDELQVRRLSELTKELEQLKERHKILSGNYITLKNNYDELEHSHNSLHTKVEKLEKEIAVQQQQLQSYKQLQKRFNDGLSKVFTQNQVDMLIQGKKHPKRWPLEDIHIAFTIRYLSKKCYDYLRHQLNFPLPANSSLKRWAKTMNMKSELLEGVLQLMQITSANKSCELEKICVLCFDEITVINKKGNNKNDRVAEGSSEMTVLMARGLFSQWKQPLYVEFDVTDLMTILHYIIDELHDINYQVVAVICKPSDKNRVLWSNLGVTQKQPYFEQQSNKIFCFPDSQHLLKILRNHFIDSGFVLANGQTITKAPLEELVECNAELDVSSISKLGRFHIEVPEHRRNDVRCASELFSKSTVSELKRYIVGKKEERLSLIKFIDAVSDWSDIVNGNLAKQTFGGKDYKTQKTLLNYLKHEIINLRVVDQEDVLPFQKEISMSIDALITIYELFQEKHGIKSMQINKINLNCIRNLFSQMKSASRHSLVLESNEALNCLRAVTMGENKLNDPSGEDFLIQRVLRRADMDDTDEIDLLSSDLSDDSVEELDNSEILVESNEEV